MAPHPEAGDCVMEPVTEADLGTLRQKLESCRDDLVAGTLREEDAWNTLREAEAMMDRGRDGPHQQTIEFIYSMLAQVWSNLHALQRLEDSRRAVDELRGDLDPRPPDQSDDDQAS